MARTMHSANEWKELRDIDKIFSETDDAELVYCSVEDDWLEKNCKDPQCHSCSRRKEK